MKIDDFIDAYFQAFVKSVLNAYTRASIIFCDEVMKRIRTDVCEVFSGFRFIPTSEDKITDTRYKYGFQGFYSYISAPIPKIKHIENLRDLGYRATRHYALKNYLIKAPEPINFRFMVSITDEKQIVCGMPFLSGAHPSIKFDYAQDIRSILRVGGMPSKSDTIDVNDYKNKIKDLIDFEIDWVADNPGTVFLSALRELVTGGQDIPKGVMDYAKDTFSEKTKHYNTRIAQTVDKKVKAICRSRRLTIQC